MKGVTIKHNMDWWNVSVSEQLGVLNEQYRISITNAMGSTKPTDNEALDSLAFSPHADRFAFEKEITCTEYDKLVIINYYRHWLNSAPERTTLLSLNSTLHIHPGRRHPGGHRHRQCMTPSTITGSAIMRRPGMHGSCWERSKRLKWKPL